MHSIDALKIVIYTSIRFTQYILRPDYGNIVVGRSVGRLFVRIYPSEQMALHFTIRFFFTRSLCLTAPTLNNVNQNMNQNF